MSFCWTSAVTKNLVNAWKSFSRFSFVSVVFRTSLVWWISRFFLHRLLCSRQSGYDSWMRVLNWIFLFTFWNIIAECWRNVEVHEFSFGTNGPLPCQSNLWFVVPWLQEQVLNGDNQYYCERCSRKHDATRRIRLKSLPPVLNFQLARFVFEK